MSVEVNLRDFKKLAEELSGMELNDPTLSETKDILEVVGSLLGEWNGHLSSDVEELISKVEELENA